MSETVGWLHAAPRHKLPHAFERMSVAPPAIDVPPHDAAVIVCFVVAPAWRRRGVASALLDAALADLAARGVALVDAFPFKAGDSTDADRPLPRDRVAVRVARIRRRSPSTTT